MSKQIEALKLALEALNRGETKLRYEAIAVIKEVLAEESSGTEQPAQQQEPYGWKVYGVNSLFMGEFAEADAKAEAKRIGGTCITFPLYTSPPAQPSKPLTDEQFLEMILRTGTQELVGVATFVGGSIQMQGKIGLLRSAKIIKEFVEAAHQIGVNK